MICHIVTTQVPATLLQVREQSHQVVSGQTGGTQQVQSRHFSVKQQFTLVTGMDSAKADSAPSQAGYAYILDPRPLAN